MMYKKARNYNFKRTGRKVTGAESDFLGDVIVTFCYPMLEFIISCQFHYRKWIFSGFITEWSMYATAHRLDFWWEGRAGAEFRIIVSEQVVGLSR